MSHRYGGHSHLVTTKQYDFTGPVGELERAQRLREVPTMTVDWIAHRLGMGTRGHVTHLRHWQGRQNLK